MHEKTLLTGALAATAIAAACGVYQARVRGPMDPPITTVSRLDSIRHDPAIEVPIRLTASDGTGLRLVSLEARGAIEDPLALTELHLVFENPEDRVLEGTFQLALPQGASLSRFAMKIGASWQEGEVVETQRAREAYEDALHRRQDPALLEQAGGNEFTARIFPIPARGKKEIIVAYSEVLEAGAAYVLPLRGLPPLASLDVDVRAAGAQPFGIHQGSGRGSTTAPQDFVIEARALPRGAGLRTGELMLARVVPFATSRPDPVASAILLVDTSASRALGLVEQGRLVQQTLAKLPPRALVTVACFDQEVVPIYEGPAEGFGEPALRQMIERGALGASDVQRALAWAGAEAKRRGARRVVLVSDGVATAGETDNQKIKAEVEKLRAAKIERIDAIALGGIRNDAFLRALVRGVLDRDGVVLDGKLGPDGLARRLGEATFSGVPVKVAGASWSWPTSLDGLQAGDEVLVHAELPVNAPVRIDVGGQQFTPDLRTGQGPLVERAHAQAKIASLVEAPTEDVATTRSRIIALSTKHRVVSPYTAMIVLETDADYRRFGIERNAQTDILTVQDGRVAIAHPAARSLEEKSEAEKTAIDDGKLRKQQTETREPVPADDRDDYRAPVAVPPEQPAELAGKKRDERAAPPMNQPEPKPAKEANKNRKDGTLSLDRNDPWAGDVAPAASATAPLAQAHAPADAPMPPSIAPMPTVAPARPAAPAPRPSPRPPAKLPKPKVAHDPLLDSLRDGTPAAPPPRPHVVRIDELAVARGLSTGEAERTLHAAFPALAACFRTSTLPTTSLSARLELNATGAVTEVSDLHGAGDAERCARGVVRGLRFPAPAGGSGELHVTIAIESEEAPRSQTEVADLPATTPYDGRLKTVMDLLAKGEKAAAFDEANRWRSEEPGDVTALVALGETLEAKGDLRTAARAYGSILELFASRADSRRFAGERLERIAKLAGGDDSALVLAIDTYGKAVAQRPDHPGSHRLYGMALLKHHEYERGFEAIRVGASRTYPAGRFRGATRILHEDLGLAAAAWTRAEPQRAHEIHERLRAAGGSEETGPSLRFVLGWETDANDVDFHIYDGRGGHAFYSHKELASGGSLYADVTTGYGPECFTIRGPSDRRAYPYQLRAHYYSRGPMGYGMGKLQVIEHDGKGNLVFDERPFVVMVDRAYVDLGRVDPAARNAQAMMK